jgi:predicted Zn-dependent protease
MTQTTLMAYSQEIAPLIRQAAELKLDLKEFKDSDEKAVKLAQAIKDAQDELKQYLEDNQKSADIIEAIKDIEKDIKLAVQAAAKNSSYKASELKSYFIARSKDEGVEKVVQKGSLFEDLTKEFA